MKKSFETDDTCLSSVLTPRQPQRSLRSVNQNLLSVPRCNSSFGQSRFSYCAPKIWNDTPLSVRQSPSLDNFKRNLKTRYFANNWPPGDCLQCLWFDILGIVRFTNFYNEDVYSPNRQKTILMNDNNERMTPEQHPWYVGYRGILEHGILSMVVLWLRASLYRQSNMTQCSQTSIW